MTQPLSNAEQKALALETEQMESRRILSKNKRYTYEVLGDDPVTATGQHRLFIKKRADGLLLASSSWLTIATAMAYEDLAKQANGFFRDLTVSWLATQKAQGKKEADAEEPQAQSLKTEFGCHVNAINVHQDISLTVAYQVAHQVEAVERVKQGTFMGPLRPEMAKLRDVYESGQITGEQFKTKALEIRGIIFSRNDNVAISQTRLDNISSSFNKHDEKQSHLNLAKDISVVYVFDRCAYRYNPFDTMGGTKINLLAPHLRPTDLKAA